MHNVIRDLFYSVFPQDKYLTYEIGNSPIILSAPHGGNIQPIDIPKRTWGNRSRDTYTRRLIQLIIERLPQKPYYVYSDIHRNRVDLNRDGGEAFQGNKKAERIWLLWNNTIALYEQNVKTKFGKGLYIDIHSHNNSDKFQIGYGLKVKDYLDIKANWKVKSKSTMSAFSENGNEFPVLFGDYSFPNSIESYRYNVLVPLDEKHYLNGGRNIKKFHNDKIGAIQIECPIPILKENLNGVADCLVYGIKRFSERFLD
jgi:hypothetical protein